MDMLVRRQLVLHNRLEKVDPACMCTKTAPARIEPPLRPALPVRRTAGLQGQQIASRYRALLTRPQIGSGGRLLRRRSELWW